MRGAVSLLALAGALVITAQVSAEPLTSIGDGLPTPGRTAASNDDASAVLTNPANLPFMPDPELRWTWVQTADAAKVPMSGHAFDLSAPFWIFGAGLRVELADPAPGVPFPASSAYQWVRTGLGVRAGEWFGFGFNAAWSVSRAAALDGQFGMSVGYTLRPASWISWAGVLRNFNLPTGRDGVTQSDRVWSQSVAVRPVDGHRAFELGLEANYYDRVERGTVGATLGLDIPYVGRLRGDVKWLDLDLGRADVGTNPGIASTVGLDVNWGPVQASGGAVFGDAVGLSTPGFYTGAAFRMFREPGIPIGTRVARIDIDETPGTRGHVRLLRKLWRLSSNDEVDGVVFVMHAEPASSLAHAEELGDAIRLLRARGKKVGCHLEDAGGRSLFVCAQADRIAMNPAGGLRFAGLSSRYYYLGGVLEKLKVDADFVRIGAHKTAAEQLTMTEGTPTAAADHQELVDEYEKVFLHDVGGGRKIPLGKLKQIVAKGPFLAKEARAAGLIDSLAYPDEIGEFVDELMGGRSLVMKSLPFSDAPERWHQDQKIAVVYLAGDMVDGESQNIPILDIRLAGSKTIGDALREAREDDSVKAVVFRIETGGGSSLAADVILREAELTAKRKPFVVSMGSSAASGGYYVAVGGGSIWANRTTVSGSIGIFYGKVDVSHLLTTLGVSTQAFRTSPRADAESLFRPFTDEERDELGRKVKDFYDLFIARVATGRHMTPEAVDAVARGKVWTGAQAQPIGLVDHVGGLRQAVDEARKLADLPEDVRVVELPEEDDSLLGFLLSLAGLSDGSAPISFILPPAMIDVVRAMAPFLVYDGTRPLARADVFESSDLGGRALVREASEE